QRSAARGCARRQTRSGARGAFAGKSRPDGNAGPPRHSRGGVSAGDGGEHRGCGRRHRRPPRHSGARPGPARVARAGSTAGARARPMNRSAAARAALAVAVLVPVVVLAAAVGLSTGAGALSLRDALRGQEPDATVLFRLRLPRVLLAAEVGAALSVAGVALQALLRNPLADPFVFGLSGGAAIGTAIVTV